MTENREIIFLLFDHVIQVIVTNLVLNDLHKVCPVLAAILFSNFATYAFYTKISFILSKGFPRFKKRGWSQTHCETPQTARQVLTLLAMAFFWSYR